MNRTNNADGKSLSSSVACLENSNQFELCIRSSVLHFSFGTQKVGEPLVNSVLAVNRLLNINEKKLHEYALGRVNALLEADFFFVCLNIIQSITRRV